MHKLATSTLALLLGAAWTVAPAVAQTTTTDKVENKAERVGEKIENKAERVGEKADAKMERAKDKLENKADRAEDKTDSKMDKVKAKAREAKEKIQDKTREAKDKVKGKMDRADARDNGDVRAVQQALRDKGHDSGPIDGVHGPRTTAAVRAFQKAQGMPDNGQIDAATREKLGVQPSASPATETPATPTDPKPQKQ